MKRQTDEEWLAAARARYAREGPAFDVAPDLDTPAAPLASAAAPRCPRCEGRPALEPIPHFILATPVPVLACHACLGVWAPAGSVSAGLTADGDRHPALRAARAPSRCRECFGWIMPDGACARCKKSPGPTSCPVCQTPMDRSMTATERLDHCRSCGGAWFDTGEFPAAFGITSRPSLVERAAQYREAENAAVLGGMLGMPVPGGEAAGPAGPGWLGLLLQAVLSILRR